MEQILTTSDATGGGKHGVIPSQSDSVVANVNGRLAFTQILPDKVQANTSAEKISFSDSTKNDATTLKHGYLPKLSGDVNDVFRGDGTYGYLSVAALIVQTAAQWAVDAKVYSDTLILVTSDVYYGATDQRQFKIADGAQTWTNLDYMPISSGGGDLAATLVLGNTTGGTNIEVSAGDSIIIDDATALRIAAIGASKELTYLPVITYPDLTELSYVKGVTSAIQTQLGTKEVAANKDASGGYVGLTLFKINFKNALNTFTSFFTNANTGARTYTFPDYDATIATQAGTETLTNKRIAKRVVTVSDATSITPNTDNADMIYQANTQALGTLTINADTGTPTDGQSLLLIIKSTNVQTFSWNAQFVGGTTALPTVTSGATKRDKYAFMYSTVSSKWEYSGSALGYT
jgi:hypothetical protein